MRKVAKAKAVVKPKAATKKVVKKKTVAKSKLPAINFTMKKDLYKQVLAAAKQQKISVSEQVRRLISQSLSKDVVEAEIVETAAEAAA